MLTSSCGRPPRLAGEEILTWRTIGSWSGHGNSQTESFSSDTGSLRVRWQTRNETPAGKVVFRLTLHSSISGRPLNLVADQAGVGGGTKQIDEDPRAFYLVVESASVDWSVTVEEGVVGRVAPKAARLRQGSGEARQSS